MVAVTDTNPDATPAPPAVDGASAAPQHRRAANRLVAQRGHDRKVWFWIPLTILMIGVWSIPSGIGVALSAVVFVHLMRRRTRRTTAQRGLRCWFRVLGPAAAIAIRRGDGSTAVRVSQTIDRENAAAVVTARSGAGAVVIDDLR